MRSDIEKIIADERELSAIVCDLAERICSDYSGRDLVIIGVLKGSFIFLADLVRRIDMRCTLDFLSASSYGAGTASSGCVRIKKDIDCSIEGKDVLLVEDILDSGNTLFNVKNYLSDKYRPVSISICTLFDKPSRRTADISADYAGMTVDDSFIVGYGLDYDEKYRNLPYVGILKPEIYS